MTISSIKVKVVRKATVKLKVLPKFPANVSVANFLTIARANGTYTFGVDYSVLESGPIVDPTTAFVAISDTSAGIYRTVTLASLLTSGLDADLQAIAALTGTGILARTAANTWVLRTVTGTANEITVTNGDGVSGAPTLSLPTALTFTGKTITGGTFNSPTLVTPALGTPASGVATNLTGTASGLTAGHVTTNANLTGDVTSLGNASTIAANAVTNAKMATMAAWTFKANNTSGAATPTDIAIDGLTLKASPAAGDEIIIWDVAGSALKKATVSGVGASAGVSSLNGQTGAVALFSQPQGRVTLSTGAAVMTSTVSGATTVYYTPSNGNLIPIYDGTNMVPTVFSEISQLTTDTTKSPAACTTNSNYDVFVWNDSGTIRATRGPAWSSNTSRGTGAGTSELQLVNGIYLNKNAITNGPAANRGTYVGTIRTNGSSQVDYSVGGSASGGTAGSLGVWNMYNRNLTTAIVVDTGIAYSYTSATFRQARASAGNQVAVLVGLVADALTVYYTSSHNTAAASSAYARISIGEDSTSTVALNFAYGRNSGSDAASFSPVVPLTKLPLLGFHTYAAIESGDGTNSTSFNVNSTANLVLSVWN